METGYYYTASKVLYFLKSLDPNDPQNRHLNITQVEMTFMRLSCTGMTYRAIAAMEMKVSPRTVDGYRETLW